MSEYEQKLLGIIKAAQLWHVFVHASDTRIVEFAAHAVKINSVGDYGARLTLRATIGEMDLAAIFLAQHPMIELLPIDAALTPRRNLRVRNAAVSVDGEAVTLQVSLIDLGNADAMDVDRYGRPMLADKHQRLPAQSLTGQALYWAVAERYGVAAMILDGQVVVEASPGNWLPFDAAAMLRSLVMGHCPTADVPDELVAPAA